MWLWNIIWRSLATVQWCSLHSAPSVLKGSLFSPQKARKMHFVMHVTGEFRENWYINETFQKFNQWLLQPWDGNTAINISSHAFCLVVCLFVWGFWGVLFLGLGGFAFLSKENYLSMACWQEKNLALSYHFTIILQSTGLQCDCTIATTKAVLFRKARKG